jgi:hypothetical protein
MSARTDPRRDLDRLTDARPAIASHSYLLVDRSEEDRILGQILSSPSPSASRPQRRVVRFPVRATLIALSTAAMAAAASLVAVNVTAGHTSASRPVASPATSNPPVIDAATLAHRTTLAVSAAEKDIEYTQVSYATGTAGGVATLQLWTYGPLTREYLLAANGTPNEKMSGVVIDGSRYRRFIDYPSQTWCEDSIAIGQYGQLPVGSLNRDVTMTLTHHGNVIRDVTLPDGTRAIQVTRTYQDGHMAGLPEFANPEVMPALSAPHSVIRKTVWIDAATYLPFKLTLTAFNGTVIESQSLSWLPPTTANLAPLPLHTQVPVPPGFTQTTDC